MRKIILLSIILSGFGLFFVLFPHFAKAVSAQESDLPKPGTLPDSTFYFLKTWKESIQTFFTFGAESKAKQFLHLAEVRLAEYQKMAEKGKEEIAQKTLDKYEKQLNNALAKVEELKNKGKDVKDISGKIETATAKHIEVLERNLIKVSEAAKEGLKNAIENSQKVIQDVSKKPAPTPTPSSTPAPATEGKYDNFAKCLSNKGAKMYGASWCSHCANQKNMFGESVKYLPYVECVVSGSQTQAPVCQSAGIKAYPTWIFPSGKKNEGELTLEQLSQYSGCKLQN